MATPGRAQQFQAIAVLSVESDAVRFSVFSSSDGRQVATALQTLPLITYRVSAARASCHCPPGRQRAVHYSADPAVPSAADLPAVEHTSTMKDRTLMNNLSTHGHMLADDTCKHSLFDGVRAY